MTEPEDEQHAAILHTLTKEITQMAKLSPGLRRVAMQAAGHSVEVEWTNNPGQPTAAPVQQPQSDTAELDEADEARVEVRAPLVGTFYAAPQPGAPPFVSVGDTVEKGQTLAIIEAMKLMNPLLAECAGTVEKVLVANGDPVEFDQPLFVLTAADPDSAPDQPGSSP